MCQSDNVVDKYEYDSHITSLLWGDSILVIGLGPGDTIFYKLAK